jgi:hypothetical protein
MGPATLETLVSTTSLWASRIGGSLRVLSSTMCDELKLLKPASVWESFAGLGIPDGAVAGIGVFLLACLAAHAVRSRPFPVRFC